jgi:hypothetical protein
MSLNNISLNNHLLSQLYPKSLLETEVQPGTVPAKGLPKEQPPATKPAPAIHKPLPAAAMERAEETIVATPAKPIQQTFIPEVAPDTEPVAEPVTEYGNTPSLGGNKKGILILVSNPGTPFLPDADLEFLSAIIGACRLSIADVAIINFHHYPQPYTQLLEQFNSRQVLLMGVTPQQLDLPFHFPHFQLQNFDQRTYLSAFPLGQMAKDRDLKMQLWSCLKVMFEV